MHDAARNWLLAAIDMGADVLGGVPFISDDPIAFLDMVFALSSKADLPLDLHIDEHLNADKLLFEPLAGAHRSAWHAEPRCSQPFLGLSALGPVAAARNYRTACAGWHRCCHFARRKPIPPRSRCRRFAAARLNESARIAGSGVRVAAGSDNIQDPFVPTGRATCSRSRVDSAFGASWIDRRCQSLRTR